MSVTGVVVGVGGELRRALLYRCDAIVRVIGVEMIDRQAITVHARAVASTVVLVVEVEAAHGIGPARFTAGAIVAVSVVGEVCRAPKGAFGLAVAGHIVAV